MSNTEKEKSSKKKVTKKVKVKKEKTPKVEKVRKTKKKIYFDFKTRFIINILLIVVCILSLIYFLNTAIKITENEIIKYTEKSNIDYKVYLKTNDFYEKPFLNKDMVYVASLIDKIVVNYDYKFNVNEKSNINYKYKVIAKLVITSQNNQKVFYEKKFTLVDDISKDMIDSKQFNINQDVTIDYGYYNNIANKFKSNYAVNTQSYLEVYLQVNEENKSNNFYTLDNKSKTILTIPISEQEVSINLDNQKVNEEKQVISNAKFIIANKYFLYGSVLWILLIIIFVIRLIKKIALLKNKTNAYDRYINRILRAYDRIIVNVRTAPKLEEYNIIKVENFEELIDVRDNTKEPIQYYVITEHQKCEFFVTNDNDLYLYVFKEIDLNDKK